MSKEKNSDNKTIQYGVLSAGLVFAVGIVIFTIRKRLFGEYTFMHADLAAQYSSIAKLFLRQLFVNHNIVYSWDVSMGSDTIPLYAFYSCFSPFTLIYAFDFNIDLLSFFVTFGKLGLSAFAFNWFLRKYIHVETCLSVAFAISYALSGFALAYYSNMIWFDGLYMLPVIIALIFDLIFDNKNVCLLTLAYAYIFVVNFYSGYIIGIFSAIVFVALLFRENTHNIKKIINICMKFIIASVSAACLSALVLYPTAIGFLRERVDDSSAFIGLHLNVMDIYNQLFIGQTSGREIGRFPYIYCGLFSLILVLLFFFNKKISKKDRIIAGALLIIYVAASLIPVVYLFLHCFDTPDCYNFRYSYLIIFMLLSLAGVSTNKIDGINVKKMYAVCSIGVLIFVAYSFFQEKLYDDIIKVDFITITINIVFLTTYSYLISVYVKNKNKLTIERIIVVLIIVELGINGLYYENINVKVNSEETESYFFYNNQIEDAVDSLKEYDNSWYRIYSPNSLYCNDSMKYGYKSVGLFSSYQNQNLRKILGKLGYVSSALTHRDMGSTEVTRMLMGEKYEIVSSTWTERLDNAYYQALPYYLPIGYMVSDDILDLKFNDKNPFANQNNLLSAMLGEKIDYYYNTGKEIQIEYYNACSDELEEYPTFKLEDVTEPGYVMFRDLSNNTHYAYFSTPYVMERSDSPIVTNSTMTIGPMIMDSFLLSPHIVETAQDDSDIYIVMGGNKTSWATFENAYFYGSDEEVLPFVYEKLSKSPLIVGKFKDGYIEGDISVQSDGVMFTSIPYQSGWKVLVDGYEGEIIPLVGGAFVGVKLPIGDHNIVLKYYDNNITVGFKIAIIGLLLVLVLTVQDIKKAASEISK